LGSIASSALDNRAKVTTCSTVSMLFFTACSEIVLFSETTTIFYVKAQDGNKQTYTGLWNNR